jgi:hypothetical protein
MEFVYFRDGVMNAMEMSRNGFYFNDDPALN